MAMAALELKAMMVCVLHTTVKFIKNKFYNYASKLAFKLVTIC